MPATDFLTHAGVRLHVFSVMRDIMPDVKDPAGPAARKFTWFATFRCLAATVLCALACIGHSQAQTNLYWGGGTEPDATTPVGGAGSWNVSNKNWTTTSYSGSGASYTEWADGNHAIFGGANGGTVITALSPTVDQFLVEASDYVFRILADRNLTVTSFGGSELGSSKFQLGSTGHRTLTLTIPTGSTTYSGLIEQDSTGNLSLTKSGFGTLALSGANTYQGTTTVSQGTLLINNLSGSGTGTGPVVVNSGATLGGTGSISGSVTVSGNLAPGASVGVLNTGDLALNSTATLQNELGRQGGSPVSDRLNVTGSVSFASGSNLQLNIATGMSTPAIGDIFFLVSNDSNDPIGGVFTRLNGVNTDLNEGSEFVWNSQEWRITYQADFGTSSFTGGNDLALLVIPEPSSALLLGAAALGLAVLRRRAS